MLEGKRKNRLSLIDSRHALRLCPDRNTAYEINAADACSTVK